MHCSSGNAAWSPTQAPGIGDGIPVRAPAWGLGMGVPMSRAGDFVLVSLADSGPRNGPDKNDEARAEGERSLQLGGHDHGNVLRARGC